MARRVANIRGTYHLLEACRRHMTHVRRVVVASSDEPDGEPVVLPYREDHPLRASFPYDCAEA